MYGDVTRGQGFGAEMSMIGKNNFCKRNQTAILDIDNRELQEQINTRGGTEQLRK